MTDFLSFDEPRFLTFAAKLMVVCGILAAIALQFLKAEYGRYFSSTASTNRWGFGINARIAWFVQELPSFLVPCILLYHAREDVLGLTPNLVLLSLYLLHYSQRSFIYPFLIRGGKPTPILISLMALTFCLGNGYLQGRYLTKFGHYSRSWFYDPRFISGVTMFAIGMVINIHSDHILRNLRKPGETGYKIPKGGMFEFVSGANFFGEIVEWSGFALASWSFPALAFALFTALNIGPRAVQHHRWYLEKFEDYPKSRRAVIPFLL